MLDEIEKTQSAVSSFVIFQTPLEQIRESIAANLGNDGASAKDFDRIKMPTGGGTAWTIPTLTGEKLVPDLTGIITGWRDRRAYWSKPLEDSDGNAPPDCQSHDAHTGHGNPGGDCRKCPYAQFGSDQKGIGQACKRSRDLALLLPDRTLPVIVNLSATSVEPSRKYGVRLTSVNIPFYGATTKVGLERTKSNQGIPYSLATFELAERLATEQTEFMKAYSAMIRPLLESAPEMLISGNVQQAAGELI